MMDWDQPKVYAVKHKDEIIRADSRSGGIFTALSDLVLSDGGVIYGCILTDDFIAAHIRAERAEERNKMRGSKYIQSKLGDTFKKVREDLYARRKVLFSGTSCQVAGLKKYLGKEYDNLFCVDIVCHGVPAPYLWRDFLAYMEKKQGDTLCRVNFRDKQEFGWAAHKETFTFEHGFRKTSGQFTFLFYKHIMFRHSCGVCPYTNTRRPGDLTVADFWGWQKTDPAFNADDKGVSLVLLNTERGRSLFAQVRDKLQVIPVRLENALQPNLCHPSAIHPRRMDFENDYLRKGFEYVLKKYGELGWRHRVQAFRQRLKFHIKRMLHK